MMDNYKEEIVFQDKPLNYVAYIYTSIGLDKHYGERGTYNRSSQVYFYSDSEC